MDKTRTVGQKWLANELELHFLTLKRCTKGQSNRLILSKVIVLTNETINLQTHRHTFAKTIFFFWFRGSQNVDIDKNGGGGGGGGQILHKYNTFSDEKVKRNNEKYKK